MHGDLMRAPLQCGPEGHQNLLDADLKVDHASGFIGLINRNLLETAHQLGSTLQITQDQPGTFQ